jgi:hypothetical protein
MYSIEALKKNVEDCYRNIKHFEQAIDTEHERVKELKKLIRDEEEAQDDGKN